MSRKLSSPLVTLIAVAGCSAALSAVADDTHRSDFGKTVEMALHGKSDKLFGIKRPLGSSAAETSGPYRSATQTAYDQVLVAKGLKVDYLTRNAPIATSRVTAA